MTAAGALHLLTSLLSTTGPAAQTYLRSAHNVERASLDDDTETVREWRSRQSRTHPPPQQGGSVKVKGRIVPPRPGGAMTREPSGIGVTPDTRG